MTAFLILLLSVFSSEIPSKKEDQENMTTYYFIRHAEKETSDPQEKDPALSDAGLRRTAKWIETFKDVQFDRIYSTDFQRTRNTAGPIAEVQDVVVEYYDHRNLFSQEFQKITQGKTVLIVGHSNTNPQFVNRILGKKKYSGIAEDEFGSLFIVQTNPEGTTSSQLLYIN